VRQLHLSRSSLSARPARTRTSRPRFSFSISTCQRARSLHPRAYSSAENAPMPRLPGSFSPVLSDRSAAAPAWQRSVSLPGSPPERSAASRAGEPSCQPSDPTPKRRSGRQSRDTKDSDRPIQSPGSAVPLKQSRNPQEPRTTREVDRRAPSVRERLRDRT
jgi:hypothetical protein